MPWRVESLITPDYGCASYQSYVAEVLNSWLDRGITGWRMYDDDLTQVAEVSVRLDAPNGCRLTG